MARCRTRANHASPYVLADSGHKHVFLRDSGHRPKLFPPCADLTKMLSPHLHAGPLFSYEPLIAKAIWGKNIHSNIHQEKLKENTFSGLLNPKHYKPSLLVSSIPTLALWPLNPKP